MHSSNFSSSNGSTEDLFRDSIDSCDNDITEKVGPGALCMSLACVGVGLQAAPWGLGSCATSEFRVRKGSGIGPFLPKYDCCSSRVTWRASP